MVIKETADSLHYHVKTCDIKQMNKNGQTHIQLVSFQCNVCRLHWSKSILIICSVTHTHTHPFNGPLSGTTQVSRYQKGKTNPDFTEARDSEWQWHQLGHMQVCTLIQTDNHASNPPLSFLQAGCPSCCPTNSVKALKALVRLTKHFRNIAMAKGHAYIDKHSYLQHSHWYKNQAVQRVRIPT